MVRRKAMSTSHGLLAGLSEFTDLEPIAAGGTSQVFRARQPAMDRLVAIKILCLAAADPQVRARFERELAITGRLSGHPLFVTVYGHGISDAGYPFFVMPWYDGGSLADVLQSSGPVPVPSALATGVRMAAALGHLHEQGLVHRDVKPANVLRTTRGESVLADFGGAAREAHAQTVTTVVSPLHVAPELLLGAPATARADVWSLASTLCTALAGQPPFVVAGPGGQPVRDMTRLREPAPPALGGVPDELRDVLICALNPQPNLRPRAAEFLDQLRSVQASLNVCATEVPGSAPATILPAARRPAPIVRSDATASWTPSAAAPSSPTADITLLRPAPPVESVRTGRPSWGWQRPVPSPERCWPCCCC